MADFETKDSGKRAEYSNGFVRDTDEGKPNFGLLLLAGVPYNDQPLTEHAALLTRGAEKYTPRNWERAFNPGGVVPEESEELERAKGSMLRHAIQFYCGETDEDHGSAVKFNIDFVKMLRRREMLDEGQQLAEVDIEVRDDDELPVFNRSSAWEDEHGQLNSFGEEVAADSDDVKRVPSAAASEVDIAGYNILREAGLLHWQCGEQKTMRCVRDRGHSGDHMNCWNGRW